MKEKEGRSSQIRREIRAEVKMENASTTRWQESKPYELSSDEGEQGAAGTQDEDRTEHDNGVW